MLPCFSALRLGRCRGRVRFAVLFSALLNGATSKLFPSVVESATGLAGSTFSNSSTGLSRIRANEFPCRTSILIISGDSLYIQCITVQGAIFCPNIGSRTRDGSVGGSSRDQFAFWTAFCSRMRLFDRRSKGAVSRFLSILLRHLQCRSISAISSGSCFPRL